MTTAEKLRIRCRISESCLPDADYRTRLTALHDDMLGEIEAAHAVGIRQEQELMKFEALLRRALESLEKYHGNFEYGQPFTYDDGDICELTITALKEQLK